MAKQRRLRIGGFDRVHIKPGTAQLPGLQRRQQCGLIDQAAARHIDEDRAGFHGGERGLAEHLGVAAVEHHAADHDIRLGHDGE